MTETLTEPELVLTKQLTKDLREAAGKLSRQEVRYIVDGYYQIQELRKATGNQLRACKEAGEPASLLSWYFEQNHAIERQIKNAMLRWAKARPEGRWMLSLVGIGPVLSAGILTHFEVAKSPAVSGFWRFAGLDPSVEWKKKEKRPWNASLKVLCWKAGQSFLKNHNREGCLYGKLYAERKAKEVEKNDAGGFADQAKAKLEKFKIGKQTEAYGHYSSGHLPPAHIDARARRYAVKIFIAHVHEVLYFLHFKKLAPLPYIIAQDPRHVHRIAVPSMELIPGMPEAYKEQP